MVYVVKNRLAQDLWINLPDENQGGRLLRAVRIPPRGTLQLTEEEYGSADVQAKVREDILFLLKTL